MCVFLWKGREGRRKEEEKKRIEREMIMSVFAYVGKGGETARVLVLVFWYSYCSCYYYSITTILSSSLIKLLRVHHTYAGDNNGFSFNFFVTC